LITHSSRENGAIVWDESPNAISDLVDNNVVGALAVIGMIGIVASLLEGVETKKDSIIKKDYKMLALKEKLLASL